MGREKTTGESAVFNEIKTNDEKEWEKIKQNKRETTKCEAQVIWNCADFVAFQQETIFRKKYIKM